MRQVASLQRRLTLALLAAVLLLTSWSSLGVAAWPVGGAPLTQDEFDEGVPVMAAADDGGVIVAWQQLGWIYAQKLDASGAVAQLWPAEHGVQVSPEAPPQPFEQCAPRIVGDGQGGAFILWHDGRNEACYYGCWTRDREVYLTRLDRYGRVAPSWPQHGLRVGSSLSNMPFSVGTARWAPMALNTVMTADDMGGVLIAWQELPPLSGDTVATIRMQRVSGDGRLLWGPRGALACAAPGEHLFPAIVADGNGGAVVVWEEHTPDGSAPRIYGQHLDRHGQAQWKPAGVALSETPAGNADHRVIRDQAGALRLIWSTPGTSAALVVTQRVRLHGWSLEHDEVLDQHGTTTPGPQIATASGGGIWVAWFAQADSGRQQVMVSRDPGGWSQPAGWPAAVASGVAGPKSGLALTSDARGGAFVAWLENAWSPRAVRLAPAGGVDRSWPSTGAHLDDPVMRAANLELVGDGLGGARVVWERSRYPSPDDIVLVQRLNTHGMGTDDLVPDVPGRWAITKPSAAPNFSTSMAPPAGAAPQLVFALPTRGQVDVELFDVAGRRLATDVLGWFSEGTHIVDARQIVPGKPGVYYARLKLGGVPFGTRQVIRR